MLKEYRKQRYLFEERIKSQSGYSDDIKQPKQTEAFKRKIKERAKFTLRYLNQNFSMILSVT